MMEPRIIDANKIDCLSLEGVTAYGAKLEIDAQPTIDPETLQIVKELRGKLAQYEQAEKDGLLIMSTVPIGSTVYTVVESYNGVFGRIFEIHEEKFKIEMISEVGKTVFADWSDAVAAAGKMYGAVRNGL